MPAKERTLRRIVIRDRRELSPFNEPARDQRVLNKPLWLHQRDVLAAYTREEREIPTIEAMPSDHIESIVYRDNLFFDEYYITEFMRQAKKRNRAVRAAFSMEDGAFREHAASRQRAMRSLRKARNLAPNESPRHPLPPAGPPARRRSRAQRMDRALGRRRGGAGEPCAGRRPGRAGHPAV